jgi:hypothetical protein
VTCRRHHICAKSFEWQINCLSCHLNVCLSVRSHTLEHGSLFFGEDAVPIILRGVCCAMQYSTERIQFVKYSLGGTSSARARLDSYCNLALTVLYSTLYSTERIYAMLWNVILYYVLSYSAPRLVEWRRVLRVGGILMLSVPDLQKLGRYVPHC